MKWLRTFNFKKSERNQLLLCSSDHINAPKCRRSATRYSSSRGTSSQQESSLWILGDANLKMPREAHKVSKRDALIKVPAGRVDMIQWLKQIVNTGHFWRDRKARRRWSLDPRQWCIMGSCQGTMEGTLHPSNTGLAGSRDCCGPRIYSCSCLLQMGVAVVAIHWGCVARANESVPS